MNVENMRSAKMRGKERARQWRRRFESNFYAPDAEMMLNQMLSQLPPEVIDEAAKEVPEIKDYLRAGE